MGGYESPFDPRKDSRRVAEQCLSILRHCSRKSFDSTCSSHPQLLKEYFEEQLERRDIEAYEASQVEEVLMALSPCFSRLRSDEAVEQEVTEMMAEPRLSEEEAAKKLKEWEKVESLVKASGKKHWWE